MSEIGVNKRIIWLSNHFKHQKNVVPETFGVLVRPGEGEALILPVFVVWDVYYTVILSDNDGVYQREIY